MNLKMINRATITLKKCVSGLMLTVATIACVDIEGPERPLVDPVDVLAGIEISTRSVMMQVGDTLPVHVIATSMEGTQIPIADPLSVTWISADPLRVFVDSTGNILALGTTSQAANIIAKWTYNGITATDTIPVLVTVNRLDVDDIRLISLDSTNVGPVHSLGHYPHLRIDAYKDGSVVLTGATLLLTSDANVEIRRINPPAPAFPRYEIQNPNWVITKFYVRARGNVYGTEVADSIEFQGLYRAGYVGYAMENPETGEFAVGDLGTSGRNIQRCADVVLYTISADLRPIEIVFSDSAEVSDCDPAVDDDAPFNGQFMGGNMHITYDEPFMIYTYNRKSSALGKVTYFIRDAVTKERLSQDAEHYVIDTR